MMMKSYWTIVWLSAVLVMLSMEGANGQKMNGNVQKTMNKNGNGNGQKTMNMNGNGNGQKKMTGGKKKGGVRGSNKKNKKPEQSPEQVNEPSKDSSNTESGANIPAFTNKGSREKNNRNPAKYPAQQANEPGKGGSGKAPPIIFEEDSSEEVAQELARLCTDEPHLKYRHFNQNLGTNTFQDCSWVKMDPTGRCDLEMHDVVQARNRGVGKLYLSDMCPLSCGRCPTAPLDEKEIPRKNIYSTNDLTATEVKKINRQHKKKQAKRQANRGKREPCPCPDDEHQGDTNEGDGIRVPSPVPPPTAAPTLAPADPTESPTSMPTSETTSWTTSTSTFWSSTSLTSTTTFWTSEAVNATISSQTAAVDDGLDSRTLAIILAVVPAVLLLCLFCCICRCRKRKKSKVTDYPIHNVKSTDTFGSRILNVLSYFNGRQHDERVDVHKGPSITDRRPDSVHRVMSVESYHDEYTRKHGLAFPPKSGRKGSKETSREPKGRTPKGSKSSDRYSFEQEC